MAAIEGILSIATSETTATETGLAIMPICAPIELAAIGRSGRMLFLIATS
ncbi:Uncharacterised protein [Serratia marcescens]|nr:Uncharacterised protein [Serratia marcescens]CVC79397.1 Uncharacterised protein [Serratia marcescens]